jgi:hypothetical protein
MSIDIDVYASDVKELDETIQKALDVSDYYGTALFDDKGRLIPLEDYEYDISPTCLLGLMMEQQKQITKLHEDMQVIYDRNRGLEKEVNRIKSIIRKTSIVTNNINHSLFIEGDK